MGEEPCTLVQCGVRTVGARKAELAVLQLLQPVGTRSTTKGLTNQEAGAPPPPGFPHTMLIVKSMKDNSVATPLWPSVGVKPNTPKVEDLESSGTPECLGFDSKAQNTSHWSVLGVIGKVLKRRYRKWPRIGHLDIYNPSYGQKKGRESNWQFDSWPLKVGNRPLPDLRIESAIRRWKDLDEGYKFGLNRVAIRLYSRELWAPKVPGLQLGQFQDNFRTPTWESQEKVPFRCKCGRVAQRIL